MSYLGNSIRHVNLAMLCRCSLETSSEREIVRQIKEVCCRVAFNPNGEGASPTQDYRLPDGEVIGIGPEAYQAPEILFRPDLIGSEASGVHECLVRLFLGLSFAAHRTKSRIATCLTRTVLRSISR